MPAPDRVLRLIDRFDQFVDDYKSGPYNETTVRVEFIDPFFAAMGWDVHNEKGYAEAYREVVHEDTVKIGSDVKAPDYSFRIGGVVRPVGCNWPKENRCVILNPAICSKRSIICFQPGIDT